MLEFLNLKPEVFGLDIDDSSVKIVKLKNKGNFFSLSSLNEIKFKPGIVKDGVIKDENILAKIIKSACRNAKGEKLNTKYAVVSLPEEKSFIQVIQMPKMEEGELRGALSFEAENYIPLPIDEVYLDFKSIDSENGQLDILITAVPKITVNSYVSCIKEAGLIPVALEVESEAIARALVKGGTSQTPLAILDVGKNTAGFIVFCGRSIRFTTSIKVAREESSAGAKARVRTISISDPAVSELISQVDKYIDFYQSHANNINSARNKIKKIILAGGGADSKGLAELVSKELKIPVELGDPWSNVIIKQAPLELSKFYKNPLPFSTAIGLAIRGADASDMAFK